MASLVTVRIDKGSSPNLGFRLQGGKDFATPLVIQKVNGGSPAERAGLTAGDAVIKINSTDVFNLRHKDAQDVVMRAGTCFDVTVQRGGSTWKPSVVPTGSYTTPSQNINNISPVTRTSLAAKSSENIGAIGRGHNLAAKPFSPQVNGTVNGGPKPVNKQYNSPIKLYSEESIAETLSAQTEVLPTGALGVNFKKNEKNYDASNSAVLRALKEAESEPRTPDEEPDSGIVTAPNSGIAGLRHVHAPENRPAPANPQLPPGQNICADCERLIVGVFVRIKDKNLHVECFKCSTCGSSLKNVGYYNINNKLYCDIHAKAAAIRANQNPNLVPVTVSPGGKAPAHAISAALSTHSLPSPSPLSPKLNNSFASPYQEHKENVDVSSSVAVLTKSNVNESSNNNLSSNATPVSFSKFLNKASTNHSGPKPFSSVSAPLSPHDTHQRTAPLSPVAPSYNTPSYTAPSFSPASSAGRLPAKKPVGGLFKEQVNELCHANQNENSVELEEIDLQMSKHIQPPTSVPVYTQISITIPSIPCTSPQLDSLGSSPKSDYSSYSSSSGKQPSNSDSAREKIMSDIRSLTPKLKNVNLSEKQSPRINYMVNNVETMSKIPHNSSKKVTSELFIPIYDHDVTYNSDYHSNSDSQEDHTRTLTTNTSNLPDNLTFANHNIAGDSNRKKSSNIINIGFNEDVDSNKRNDRKPTVCNKCNTEISRGPFITALGKIWCPNHFICTTPSCKRPLQDLGFVEEQGQLYCEYCFERYLAPDCSKCGSKIKGDCLKAIGKNFHPECFNCVYCGKLFGNNPFFIEDGSPYCEADWNELFTTKCFACGFPVEAGDRWVEALNNNYHSQCFNCTMCKKNLEGQSFFAKGGRPFCKNHAR